MINSIAAIEEEEEEEEASGAAERDPLSPSDVMKYSLPTSYLSGVWSGGAQKRSNGGEENTNI